MLVRPAGSRVRREAARWSVAVGAVTALIAGGAAPAAAVDPGVAPATVTTNANPGTSIPVNKTVHTPAIPPNPDVVLLVDTTGSMTGAIDNVKDNLDQVVTAVRAAQSTAQFAVASYRDAGDGPELFRVRQNLTADETAVQAAVDGLDAGGGGDAPEAWGHALYQVSSGAITYRAGSSRIVVLIGDAPSQTETAGIDLTEAAAALTADGARVVAVNVSGGVPGALNATGQVTTLLAATGGQLVDSTPDTVSAAILAGLRDLDVTVTPKPTCQNGLSVTFDAAHKTAQSGTDIGFAETITVAPNATQGATLTCTVEFLLNDKPAGPAFTQQITVKVNDVTPPVVSCTPSTNPAGHEPSSRNPDGFYQLSAIDLVDPAAKIYVVDSADTLVRFGAYRSGTKIKLVQAPGGKPGVKPGTGDVDYKITLRGDALIVGVDSSGNSAQATCLVPPGPK